VGFPINCGDGIKPVVCLPRSANHCHDLGAGSKARFQLVAQNVTTSQKTQCGYGIRVTAMLISSQRVNREIQLRKGQKPVGISNSIESAKKKAVSCTHFQE
jgi:hypothetical protein